LFALHHCYSLCCCRTGMNKKTSWTDGTITWEPSNCSICFILREYRKVRQKQILVYFQNIDFDY
jgi:hypothetical protein